MRPIQIIGAASGLGAQDHGCADGPEALRSAGLQARLTNSGLSASWMEMLRPLPTSDTILAVAELCTRLAQSVYDSFVSGSFPFVVGGDHACAIGTWSGLHRAIDQRALGLIWIDAHMDSHTPETSLSGALHGMPLASLLGYGPPMLTAIASPAPQLLPQHVCLIGVRSFETSEASLLAHLGVRIFTMDEIRQRGLETVIAEALRIVQPGTAGFGISIDLDALDPREDPGVGSPVENGLFGHELIAGLQLLRQHPSLLGLELMEYNPHRDLNLRTAQVAMALAHVLLGH